MRAKELYQLGAISGTDYEILQKALSDPAGVKANLGLGTSGLLTQVDTFAGIIQRNKANLRSVYQGQPGTQTPPAPAVPLHGGPAGVLTSPPPAQPQPAPAKPRPPIRSFYR
jgi:hypothetical protein